METIHLTDTSAEEWWKYYDRVGNPGPYHRPDYLEILTGHFEHDEEQPEAFVMIDSGDVVYYPYVRRPLTTVPFAEESELDLSEYSDIVSSWYWGGPFTSRDDGALCEEFADEFRRHCHSENIVAEFTRFDPNRRNHERFHCLSGEVDRETVWVDLEKDEQTIWDEFEKRNRNAIRQARNTELEIVAVDGQGSKAFYEIYSNAMDAKNASDHYRFDFEFFASMLESDLSTLLVARHDDEVIGGSMLVHDDSIAHDYLRASDPDYWDMRVNNLLCFEAIMQMKQTGRDRFDFQGGRPGVFRFKKSFSPERGKLMLGRDVYLEEMYDKLVDEAKSAGIDTNTEYFPVYRADKSN